MRIGLIGAGPWGRKILKTLQGMPGAALSRVASRNPETAALAGPGCMVSADWREVASAPDLDAVIVATPPSLHADVARAAIEAGRAVLVEKPLALDLAQARGLLELARAKNAFVQVDHVHLFHPAWRTLKQSIGAFGPPQAIRSWGGNRGPFHKDVPALWDYGPHDVALAVDLVGRAPERVEARLTQTAQLAEGRADNLELRLHFGGALKAVIEVGNLFASKRRRFEADFTSRAGRHTWIFDDLAKDQLLFKPEGGPADRRRVDPTPPLECALRDFLDGVRRGSRDLSGLELGVRVVEVLAMADQVLGRTQIP